MPRNFVVNRRSLLLGTSALSLTGLLAACGGGNGGNTTSAESASALGVGEDIAKLVSINPKKREELKEGGEVNLPVLTLGPNFNPLTSNGNSTESIVTLSSIATAAISGLWMFDYEGKASINPDFCDSFDTTTEGGKQVHRIKLNSKAKFNDGTPIDIKSLQSTHKILSGKNKDFNIVQPGAFEFVESIEQDGDFIKVTMAKPYYPVEAVFSSILHPELEDPAVFNDGFVDKLHPEWQAGPFTVEEWNSAEKRLSVKPNENWWGEKPVLERINFRQMEASAQRAAFKNGEVDAVGASTLTAYKEVEGVENTEMRRGQRLFAGGVDMSSGRLPLELRKAIMVSIDRKALADIRFQGLNWAEETPGSMLLMPFSEYYEDNFSKVKEKWGEASKILEEAGYKKDGDFYKKDGKNAKFAITNFGDDPVGSAMAQNLVQQMKSAGIEATIDSQPEANLGNILGNREFEYAFAGYSVGSDATSVTSQFYLHSNAGENMGNDEIDKMIEEMQGIEDSKKRNEKCNEIERKHLETFAAMTPFFNGPAITAAKKGLANYGPSLFGSLDTNPHRWSILGWVKE